MGTQDSGSTGGLLDRIATLVTRRRGLPLLLIAVAAVTAGVFLPSIEVDPSPEGLVSEYGDQEEAAARLRSLSGDTDRVVVMLVRAGDVLAPEPLAYVHRLSRRFEEAPFVERVESLTVSSLPRRDEEPDELTLEDLEALEEEGESDEPTPEVLNALDAIVRAEPGRFPEGVASLSPGAETIDDAPAVAGDEVDPAEIEALRGALEDAPLITGRLVSADHTVTAVVLRLPDETTEWDRMTEAVEKIDAVLAELPPPDGVERITGGLPHLRTAVVDKMVADQMLLVPLTLLVCIVLLFLSFRWLPATLLPIVAVALTALITVGGMAAVSEPMNILNNIIPALLIIIGVSDSIHLINRYREELARDEDRRRAAWRTVRAMTIACFLTSVTTAVGLGSLLVSQTELLRRFGLTAATGVLVAYVVTIAFLPPALTGFRPPSVKRSRGMADAGWLEKAVVAVAAAAIRYRWPVLTGAAALLGVSIWAGTFIEVDTALMDHFDERDEVYHATRVMDEQLSGVRPLEVLLRTEEEGAFRDPELLAVVSDAESWAEEQPGILRADSATTYLQEARYLLTGDPEARDARFRTREQVEGLLTLLDQREDNPADAYVSEDGRLLRIEVRMQDVGAQRTIAFIDSFRDRLRDELPQSVSISMTGEAYTGSVAIASVVDDLLGSLATAVIVIFGMLTLLFRSLRLGLLSIPPNVIPLVGTVAWMVVRDIPLNIATAIIFSISLGLAVDGTIHVLARFREETRSGAGVDDALLRAAGGTGRAIVVSSTTLMFGFAVLLLSAFVPVRHFGELIAITVASCLLATLVVQPALLKVGAPRPKG